MNIRTPQASAPANPNLRHSGFGSTRAEVFLTFAIFAPRFGAARLYVSHGCPCQDDWWTVLKPLATGDLAKMREMIDLLCGGHEGSYRAFPLIAEV